MLLQEQLRSWGTVLSQQRISTVETAVSVAISQVEPLRSDLPTSMALFADCWYVTGPFVSTCHRLQMPTLLRVKRNRKLYRPAPARQPGQREASRRDGELFEESKPHIWEPPDARWSGTDWGGKPISVQGWHQLHLRQAREVQVTVFRILREGVKGSKRDPDGGKSPGHQAGATRAKASSYEVVRKPKPVPKMHRNLA